MLFRSRLCGRICKYIRESLGDASPGARAESIQTVRRTRRAKASHPGSRVDGISINNGDETGDKGNDEREANR